MNSVKTWSTKEEVLKDLAMVSGRAGTFDESYLVVGNGPPPVLFEAEDDEMMQQFGDAIHGRGFECENAPPDLQGITDLIRMVEESDESDCEDLTNQNYVIAITKGTKLNPNVKEFVPKGALSSHSSSDVSESKPSDNVKTEVKAAHVNNKRDVPSEGSNEVESEATKLKNKIIGLKADSFETKKQNNVAIASLLRLYASKTTTQNITEPVKLMTPDYYESKVTPTKELDVVTSQSSSTTPVPKSDPSSTPSLSSIEAKSEPMPCTRDDKTSPVKPKLDPAIKKSIEKVNQWMGEPPAQKKVPSVFLGPISFKRKEPTTAPKPSPSNTEQVRKPIDQKQYQPSRYAAELGRKYMERSKTKEAQKINSWTDLDVILKQKDEILLKKKLEQASLSENSVDSDAPQR